MSKAVKAEPTVTDTEGVFLFNLIQCPEAGETLKVDWDRLAEALGMKSGNVARIRYYQIKKKVKDRLESKGLSSPVPKPKVTKPKAPKSTKTAKATKIAPKIVPVSDPEDSSEMSDSEVSVKEENASQD